jgi:hypothetical protein
MTLGLGIFLSVFLILVVYNAGFRKTIRNIAISTSAVVMLVSAAYYARQHQHETPPSNTGIQLPPGHEDARPVAAVRAAPHTPKFPMRFPMPRTGETFGRYVGRCTPTIVKFEPGYHADNWEGSSEAEFFANEDCMAAWDSVCPLDLSLSPCVRGDVRDQNRPPTHLFIPAPVKTQADLQKEADAGCALHWGKGWVAQKSRDPERPYSCRVAPLVSENYSAFMKRCGQVGFSPSQCAGWEGQ